MLLAHQELSGGCHEAPPGRHAGAVLIQCSSRAEVMTEIITKWNELFILMNAYFSAIPVGFGIF